MLFLAKAANAGIVENGSVPSDDRLLDRLEKRDDQRPPISLLGCRKVAMAAAPLKLGIDEKIPGVLAENLANVLRQQPSQLLIYLSSRSCQ